MTLVLYLSQAYIVLFNLLHVGCQTSSGIHEIVMHDLSSLAVGLDAISHLLLSVVVHQTLLGEVHVLLGSFLSDFLEYATWVLSINSDRGTYVLCQMQASSSQADIVVKINVIGGSSLVGLGSLVMSFDQAWY